MTTKRRALGRGLAALIPTDDGAADAGVVGSPTLPAHPASVGTGSTGTAGATAARTAVAREGLRTVGIEEVHPAREQPRKTFDETKLEELASSIRTQGLIQPLVVRVREGGGYQLIAGERRWRAAQRAGLHAVPVVVRDIAPGPAFELALVENLQRADLNAIEEAEGYQWLIRELGYTQESLAGRVGRDRSTVANALRLLKLPESVRTMVAGGRLSMGHARALLGLDSEAAIERLGRRIAAQEMSVRQVEGLVRRERDASGGAGGAHTNGTSGPAAAGAAGAESGSVAGAAGRESTSARDLSSRLMHALGTRVRVVETGGGSGHLEIHFASLDQLDGLLAKLLP